MHSLEDESSPELPQGRYNAKLTECHVDVTDSPGVLKKVDRNVVDTYVNKLRKNDTSNKLHKKTAKGTKGTTSKQPPRKKQIAKKAMVVEVASEDEDGEESMEHDQLEDDAGYYWSDVEA